MTIFTTTTDQLNRVIGSLNDVIQISKAFLSFEIWTLNLLNTSYWLHSLKKSPSREEVVLEDELVKAPALYIVYDGFLEMEYEKYYKWKKALKMEIFGEALYCFRIRIQNLVGKTVRYVKRPGQRKYSVPKRLNFVLDNKSPPQSLAKLKCHDLLCGYV
ncbi:LOW QUALITY PROTEIN: hypothetical protein ACHAWX_002132 [Stephanocyclus meneghinianus]